MTRIVARAAGSVNAISADEGSEQADEHLVREEPAGKRQDEPVLGCSLEESGVERPGQRGSECGFVKGGGRQPGTGTEREDDSLGRAAFGQVVLLATRRQPRSREVGRCECREIGIEPSGVPAPRPAIERVGPRTRRLPGAALPVPEVVPRPMARPGPGY